MNSEFIHTNTMEDWLNVFDSYVDYVYNMKVYMVQVVFVFTLMVLCLSKLFEWKKDTSKFYSVSGSILYYLIICLLTVVSLVLLYYHIKINYWKKYVTNTNSDYIKELRNKQEQLTFTDSSSTDPNGEHCTKTMVYSYNKDNNDLKESDNKKYIDEAYQKLVTKALQGQKSEVTDNNTDSNLDTNKYNDHGKDNNIENTQDNNQYNDDEKDNNQGNNNQDSTSGDNNYQDDTEQDNKQDDEYNNKKNDQDSKQDDQENEKEQDKENDQDNNKDDANDNKEND